MSRKSSEETFQETLAKAIEGDLSAQSQVGNMYACGLGTKRDPVSAQQWYEKAISGGSTFAKTNLSELLKYEEKKKTTEIELKQKNERLEQMVNEFQAFINTFEVQVKTQEENTRKDKEKIAQLEGEIFKEKEKANEKIAELNAQIWALREEGMLII